MRVFLDTNILIDFYLKREPFFEDTRKLITILHSRNSTVNFSSISFYTLNYILEKEKYSQSSIREKLLWLIDNFQILYLNDKILEIALNADFQDYEDAFQYYCAVENQCDFIITRNKKDYKKTEIPVYNATELLALMVKD